MKTIKHLEIKQTILKWTDMQLALSVYQNKM